MNPQKPALSHIILDLFTSTKVVMGLFGLLVLFLVPATLFPEAASIILGGPVKAILAVLGLELLVCTLRKLKILRRSTLLIHCGSLIILAGGLISTFGSVATVNVYEGASTGEVYSWKAGKDVPLDFDLKVAKINMDFYPVPVRIGVLKNGRKADLITTRTGDIFAVDGYRVRIMTLNPFKKDVQLGVFSGDGREIGTLTTSGENNNLPPDFPLDFKLVAFQDPVVKRMWVELELLDKGAVVVSGTSEVNGPLKWQGMRIYLTQVAADRFGNRYAGLQISRDPGQPYVYAGFGILCLGLLLALKRWVGGKRPVRYQETGDRKDLIA